MSATTTCALPPPADPFDVVLLRNAAFTYLAAAGESAALARLTGTLRRSGALVIGLHESLPGPTLASPPGRAPALSSGVREP